MDEFTDRETQPASRSLQVHVYGNTAAELELAALDDARPFFGGDLILRVVPDYRALPVLPDGPLAEQAAGRKYHASITVQVIERDRREMIVKRDQKKDKQPCPACDGSGKKIERGGWGVSWQQCRACGGSGER